MATSVLNPTQQYLLKLFSYDNSEEYAREVQAVLTKHFQQELDAESDSYGTTVCSTLNDLRN